MALTRNELIGFETGGLEEASATAGTPDATEAVVVRSGARSLAMNSIADQYELNPFAHVASGGTGNIIGFGFRTTDKTPAANEAMFEVGEAVGNVFKIDRLTNGDWRVVDGSGNTIITDPTTENVWHYVECFFEHLDSGSWEVFIDGVSVASQTGRDMSGTPPLTFMRFRGTASGTIYFDDVYWLTGATAASDRLGNAEGGGVEVFKYQSVKNSATPDDGGTVLNAGTWNRAGETPLAATATNPEYTGAGAGAVDSNAANGFPEGPLNDPRIDGDLNIKAIKGIWNMKRSGGAGSDHFGLLGNDVDGTIRSQDFDPSISFGNFFFISELATVVPTSAEYCRIGFETTGAQDFECQEMWAMLLHVPTAPVLTALSQADFPDQNYYVGPFEI